MAKLRRRGFARYAALGIGFLAALVGVPLLSLCTHGSGVSIGLPDGHSWLGLYRVAPIGWSHDYRMAPAPGISHWRMYPMGTRYWWERYSLRVGDAVYEVARFRHLW